jgi:DNA mismatch repair protein MutL
MKGKYPFFVLHLEIVPSVIDFNVHPKKLNIRFENEDYIYNKVYNIVRKFVEEKFIEKEATYDFQEINKFTSPKAEYDKEELYDKFEVSVEAFEESSKYQIDKSVQLSLTDHDVDKGLGQATSTETFLREKYVVAKNFPKLRLISRTGQLSNKIYIVLEGINEIDEGGLYILDQHAASERINKEIFYDLYKKSANSKQKLISPLKIEVSPSEKFFLQNNLKEINRLGFDFEHFGGNTFIIRSIPIIMGKNPSMQIIKEIISDITEIGKDRSFSEKLEEIINYLACHKSIRGGDDLSLKDIRKLIVELANCKDSYHCAHGRPTLRFISFKELDKLFKRIV